MNNNILLAFAILFSASIIFTSCEKDKDDDKAIAAQTGTITLKFEHLWGDSDFALNTELTHPISNEKITTSSLLYYISNVKFKKTDGTWWSEANSYYLLDASSSGFPKFTIDSVPAGDYTEVTYTIGVDSTKNVSGAQTGALSTTNNMFWNWNTGYIFVKLEGTSLAAPDNAFMYHLGGFKSTNTAIEINSHNFNGQILSVSKSASPSIHFKVDVANIWSNGITLPTVYKVHMPGDNAQKIAHNFSESFKLDHIHN